MVKVTLSVSNVYKNTGAFRFHRKNTTKHWKHYFIDSETWEFGTEYVNSIKAQLLKRKRYHKIRYTCPECYSIFNEYIRSKNAKLYCPYCN